MAYIGPAPNPGQNREVDDISSGFDGGTAAFTLQVNGQNVSPGSANAIIVSLGGVVQNPGTDYTVAGSTITFTTNPASGLSFFGLVLGQQVDTEGTADGSITLNKFINGTSSNNGKFLRANNGAAPSFETVTGTTINNNADNRVITGSGTANTLNGESNVVIDSNGNLGIGVASHDPLTALHVQGSSAGALKDVLTLTNQTGSAGTEVGMVFECGADEVARISARNDGSDIGPLKFYTATSQAADPTEKMRLTAGGNLGIGEVSPGQAVVIKRGLDVDYDISTATTNTQLVIKSNGASGTNKCIGLSFNGPNSNGEGFITMVGISANEMDMHFGMRSGGSRSDKVIFASNGRVRMPGVYSTAGSSMRDVQIESDGTLCGLSSITAAKTNITDLTDVSWLYSLKPKTFNFRKKTSDIVTGENTYLDEAETEKAYGLLAEDVETVNKDFCFYDKDSEGNDVLAGVYYKTMVVPLLKAVQELKAENTSLTTRVAALEAA